MSMPSLDPDLLRAFVAVADHRSFTRAAATLNRTQSAVSMQIKRLEDRLGLELFNRTKANVDLSAAGEGLLGYARRILTLNEEAIGRFAERKIEGIVRLGVMDDYGTLVIPPLLANFLAGYPKIHVEMETGLTSSMPARLGEAYDLVIAMHPGDVAKANSCGANRRSGRPALLGRSRSRSRCLSRSIRKAACSENGRSRRSMRPSARGGWLSSATALQPSSRSRPRVSR
jgi:DNA-binding transcriptional LysR family regulator